MAVLNAVKAGGSQGIYLTDLGRLSRLLTVQEAILAKVWEYGGIVVTVESGIVAPDDDDDPMRTAMRQMMGVFFQLERSMLVKRLRNGREYKASIGGYANGAPAFGLVPVDGELVPAESEQVALKRMRELRGEGQSFQSIADTLNAEGVPTKRSGPGGKPARWQSNTINRILSRAVT